jgi:hypothetical protein
MVGLIPSAVILGLAFRVRSAKDAARSGVFYVGLVGCSMLLYALRA